MKPRILTFTEYYLPGFKSGGPVRTLANMVDQLSDDFAFRIVTLDRDFLDSVPYPGAKRNAWQRVGGAEVFYLSPNRCTLRGLRRLIRSTRSTRPWTRMVTRMTIGRGSAPGTSCSQGPDSTATTLGIS